MESTISDKSWQIGRFDHTIHPSLQEKLDRCNTLGHSNVPIILNGEMVGFVALMDTIRENATSVVKTLKSMNIVPVLINRRSQIHCF